MRSLLTLCALAAMTAGCVQSPTIGEFLPDRSDPVDFKGYASAAYATIRLECKRPGTNGWTSMGAPLTATNSVPNPGEPTLLYRFSGTRTVPNSCWTSGSFGYSTVVRVREPNASQVTQLYTFTPSGLGCAVNELVDGEDWVTAGAVCNDGNEILLYANP